MEKIDEPPAEEPNTFLHHWVIKLRKMLARFFWGPQDAGVQSEEELKKLIDDGEKQGVIEEAEHDMLHSILEFGDTVVREVMVPRIEMSCIKENASFNEVMDFVVKDGHSRIPVFKDRIDDIVGVLYVKDLLRLHNVAKEKFTVSSSMRSTFFIPETKRISELLREFQRKKVHLAIVVDEYGGTAGLVTIEDLLEELVGEIQDEYDIDTKKMVVVGEESVLADGRLEIEELEDYFHVSLKGDDNDYETVGGLIFTLLERIPQKGEKINYKDLQFTIEKVDERRIHKVKIDRAEGTNDKSLSTSLQDDNSE